MCVLIFFLFPGPENQKDSLAPIGDDVDGAPHSSSSPSSHGTRPMTSPLPPSRKTRAEMKAQQLQATTGSSYNLSTVIKLDYDLSDPIYEKVKQLVLEFVVSWLLPEPHPLPPRVQRASSTPPASPCPSPHLAPQFSGAAMLREMWFTSRDNVSMLLQVCKEGLHSPSSPPSILFRLIKLYRYWVQVCKCVCVCVCVCDVCVMCVCVMCVCVCDVCVCVCVCVMCVCVCT